MLVLPPIRAANLACDSTLKWQAFKQIAGLPYRHPADPAAYQGEQATRHFEALLNSPAFDNWVGARSELRRSARVSA